MALAAWGPLSAHITPRRRERRALTRTYRPHLHITTYISHGDIFTYQGLRTRVQEGAGPIWGGEYKQYSVNTSNTVQVINTNNTNNTVLASVPCL